jgi:hypothetical protein
LLLWRNVGFRPIADIRQWRHNSKMSSGRTRSAALWLVLLCASCSQIAPADETVILGRSVLLSVDHGPNGGPIKGGIPCSEAKAGLTAPCLADDIPLAEAALECGASQVSIDRGNSHRDLVYFPARVHERFRSIPTDHDIVRCVRDRVGFSFRASLSEGPPWERREDERPFVPLHSR